MINQPLKIGEPAPDFELMDENKEKVKLSDLRGKKVVLLFYPMDFSPTCTTEHCTFGPDLPRLQGGGETVVFGVSCDRPFSHAAYKKQYNIPYRLMPHPRSAPGRNAGHRPRRRRCQPNQANRARPARQTPIVASASHGCRESRM